MNTVCSSQKKTERSKWRYKKCQTQNFFSQSKEIGRLAVFAKQRQYSTVGCTHDQVLCMQYSRCSLQAGTRETQARQKVVAGADHAFSQVIFSHKIDLFISFFFFFVRNILTIHFHNKFSFSKTALLRQCVVFCVVFCATLTGRQPSRRKG